MRFPGSVFSVAFAFVVVLVSCNTRSGYVIDGKIKGADNAVVQLKSIVNDKLEIIDTAKLSKGSFKMKGAVDYPQPVCLSIAGTDIRTILYIENSPIRIEGDIDSIPFAKITGSAIHDEYMSFAEKSQHINDRYTGLVNKYQIANQTDDTATMADIDKKIEKLRQENNKMAVDYVKANPSSCFSPFLINAILYCLDTKTLDDLIKSLDEKVANTPPVDDLKASLEKMKNVDTGKKAPDFIQSDVDGNPVSLYSKVGTKVLLLDFWASWCDSCRIVNPALVKTYREFHNKGFDIFSVSLDSTKNKWVQAIADDGIEWTQVSDLQYWQNAAAYLYSIRSVPANFLLDENGIIVARNLVGDELYHVVKEFVENN